jgi:hypothetical protein
MGGISGKVEIIPMTGMNLNISGDEEPSTACVLTQSVTPDEYSLSAVLPIVDSAESA